MLAQKDNLEIKNNFKIISTREGDNNKSKNSKNKDLADLMPYNL